MGRTVSPRIVIVSPHRDDAAFSCGVLLAKALRTHHVLILNVFSRSGYAPFAHLVEAQGVEAVTTLRAHEDQALRYFLRTTSPGNLTLLNLDLLDAPWRLNLATEAVLEDPLTPAAYEHEVATLASLLQPHLEQSACILLPLALGDTGLHGHLDHRIVRDAGLRSAAPATLAFYEDLPYAARMHPTDRDTAIACFSCNHKLRPVIIHHPEAGLLKNRLARHYASQIDFTTVAEMSTYTATRPGEHIYAAPTAHHMLDQLAGHKPSEDPA